MSEQPPDWGDFPWLDLQRVDMCRTSPFGAEAIFQAADVLRTSGLTDAVAANILVSADSTAGQEVGVVAFVDMALTFTKGWTERTEL